MTNFRGEMIVSLRVYTVVCIRFILAELIFEEQILFMLEKVVSRPPGSALLSINTCAYKINSADMKASM